jgi:hypothetical protein
MGRTAGSNGGRRGAAARDELGVVLQTPSARGFDDAVTEILEIGVKLLEREDQGV